MSREVERKYAVDDEFAVPGLSGVGPVATVDDPETVELVATYYDTHDLRLAREGVTLRRRTGGHDAGWTLKLPVVAGNGEARDELAAPLGLSRTPPPDLLDLVTAWVRGADLAPVGELTTQRTARTLRGDDGAALAELVDDRVTVTGHGESAKGATVFREVEVELTDGADPTVLDAVGDVLRAAGAVADDPQPKLVRALGPAALAAPSPPPAAAKVRRRDPAGDLVTAYLRDQVRALLEQDARVRQDEEDAIHKARVATRRLRSALRTFAPLLQEEAVTGLGEELRWLAAELGTARDAEVILVRLRVLVRAQPEEVVLGPVAARVDERLLSDLLLARESGLAALREPRYVALLDRLVALATEPPLTGKAERPVTDLVPGRVLRALRRLERRLAPADTGDGVVAPERFTDEQLHEARKAAKRARYAVEAAAMTYGDDARAHAQVLADVQAVLGEHQDAVVARRVLRDLGVDAHGAGHNAFTYGWLAAREQAAAEAARAALPAVWQEAARGRHRRWLAD